MTIGPGVLPADRVLRTLVVDDHTDTASSLVELIEAWGYRARAAHDGATALLAFDAFRPMVALLDLQLPGQSGYDVAFQLRERAWRRRLYLVVVTGHLEVANQTLSTLAGISHHLTKPVSPDALRRILASYQFAEEVVSRPPQPEDIPPPRRGSR